MANFPAEQPPRPTSRQEILDYLHRTNFVANEPGREILYADAGRELLNGNPAKAIAILEREREQARQAAQSKNSPFYQGPKGERDAQTAGEAQDEELLTRYIEFLKKGGD